MKQQIVQEEQHRYNTKQYRQNNRDTTTNSTGRKTEIQQQTSRTTEIQQTGRTTEIQQTGRTTTMKQKTVQEEQHR